MTDLEEDLEPLLKRARIKQDTISLERVSEFLQDHDHDREDVLEHLESQGVQLEESTPGEPPSTNQTSLNIYFSEISRYELLDHDREIELSRRIDEARGQVEEFVEDQDLTEEDLDLILELPERDDVRDHLEETGVDEEDLGEDWEELVEARRRYLDAHSEMVESNLRLVVSIAKKYQHCGLDLDDLINEGNMGLMKAVDRFDHEKGYRFSTYAAWWIRQSILRALSNKGRTIRLPVYMNDLMRKWNRKREELVQELDRDPHFMEIADELNIDYEKALHIKRHQSSPTSLETNVGDGEDTTLKQLVASRDIGQTEEEVDRQFLKERLEQALRNCLDDREFFVFVRRHGLMGHEEQTLEEVGEELDLTRERIRQIQNEATERIRESEAGRELRMFLDQESDRWDRPPG